MATHGFITKQDKADMEALRMAKRDEEGLKKASEEFRKYLALKKAGKLPMYEVKGGRT